MIHREFSQIHWTFRLDRQSVIMSWHWRTRYDVTCINSTHTCTVVSTALGSAICINWLINPIMSPDWIQYAAVLGDAEQFVRRRHEMQVTLFSIVEKSIRFPNALQHFNAQTERFDRSVKGQTLVLPRLNAPNKQDHHHQRRVTVSSIYNIAILCSLSVRIRCLLQFTWRK